MVVDSCLFSALKSSGSHTLDRGEAVLKNWEREILGARVLTGVIQFCTFLRFL